MCPSRTQPAASSPASLSPSCVAELSLFLMRVFWDGDKGRFISPEGCNAVEMPLSKAFSIPGSLAGGHTDSLPPLHLIGLF